MGERGRRGVGGGEGMGRGETIGDKRERNGQSRDEHKSGVESGEARG